MKRFALCSCLLVSVACSGNDGGGEAGKAKSADAPATPASNDEAGEGEDGAAEVDLAAAGSLEYRSCERVAELGAVMQEQITGKAHPAERRVEDRTRCLRDTAEMRADTAADDATFDRFLQCRIDAGKFEDAMSCMKVLAPAEVARAVGPSAGFKAKVEARDDVSLQRIRDHAAKGVVSAETLAKIERDRDKGGPGRFGAVLDDAHAQIEAGRVKPGTTLEIHIHPALGAKVEDVVAKGEQAADLSFTDASSGRRVARVAPVAAWAISMEPIDQRVATLLGWWAQKGSERDVEIGFMPGMNPNGGAMPPQSKAVLPVLQKAGLADRPLLALPDGSRKTASEWAGS